MPDNVHQEIMVSILEYTGIELLSSRHSSNPPRCGIRFRNRSTI